MIKNLPVMQETWFQSLGWEDPLEEGIATHSTTLAYRIPWTKEPVRLQVRGSHSQTQLKRLSSSICDVRDDVINQRKKMS